MGPEAIQAGTQAVGAILGTVQSIVGSGQIKRNNRRMDRLFSQREAFTTPDEVYDILNLSQLNAAQGFSDETMAFLEASNDRTLAKSLGVAESLGADPNQLSAIIDQSYQDIFRVGNENEMLKLRKFDSFTNAVSLLARNKEAEWQSRDNLIKDRLQALASKVAGGQTNLQSGLNLGLASIANLGATNIYGNNGNAGSGATPASAINSQLPAFSGQGGNTPSEIVNRRNQPL